MSGPSGSQDLQESGYPRTNVDLPPIQVRNYTGWISLGLLFFFLIFATIFGEAIRKEKSEDTTQVAAELKQALSENPARRTRDSKEAKGQQPDPDLLAIETRLKSLLPGNSAAAALYGAVEFELHKKINASDIMILQHGTHGQRSIFEIYTASSLSPAKVRSVTQSLSSNTFFDELVTADAYAKANDLEPRNRLFAGLARVSYALNAIIGVLILASLICWTLFLILKLNGELKPLGLPNLPESIFGADRLACKALLFFGVYIVLMTVSQLVGLNGKGSIPYILSFVGALVTIGYLPYLFRMRLWGGPITGASLGISRYSPWLLYAGIGIAGFLMEFPVTMFAGFLGEKLFSHQTMTHPVEIELIGSHNPWLICSMFILASVQAPIYEEMIFRGLMLPAIARITGLGYSVLITSFLFASLHPQGIGAWLGLATIAAASCLLVYHTRSIGPSIFLHAAHNGFTLLMVLLMS